MIARISAYKLSGWNVPSDVVAGINAARTARARCGAALYFAPSSPYQATSKELRSHSNKPKNCKQVREF
jgi:hypothetical protein